MAAVFPQASTRRFPSEDRVAQVQNSAGPVEVRLGSHRRVATYRIANTQLCSDVRLPPLTAFLTKDESRPFADLAIERCVTASSRTVTGWIGGCDREISFSNDDYGTTVRVDGAGEFLVTRRGQICALTDVSNPALAQLVQEIVLGPCLAIALANRKVFLLHASAVADEFGRVILFAADSGTGKSTIARRLCEQHPNLTRVADDMVALVAGDTGVHCLPAFPQLKLDAHAMRRIAALPSMMPVRELVLPDTGRRDACFSGNLGHTDVATALTVHGVGLRLFGARALGAHFRFVTRTATMLDARKVTWAHRPDALWALYHSLFDAQSAH